MSRLPVSATRLEGRMCDVRRELPVHFEHSNREIDDEMDNIIYNAIDTIQRSAERSDLRTFYFNLMSKNDYKNRDFEELIAFIVAVIEVALYQEKFRDARDAVIAVCEDVTDIHTAYMVEEYPDLSDYIGRDQENSVDRAIRQYLKYRDAVEEFQDGGRRSRRDDRDRDRDRDRRGGPRFGSDRGRRDRDDNRRDRWDRGAVRGGVHGSPRRGIRRDNRFGNDEPDRFEDDRSNSRRDDRNDRDRDRDRDRGDRFEESDRSRSRGATMQRLPGRRRDDDIEDALAREAQEEKRDTKKESVSTGAAMSESKEVFLQAYVNQDAWVPTPGYPHPLVFNNAHDLIYSLSVGSDDKVTVKPIVVSKAEGKEWIVDFYAHDSAAFGAEPKDFNRFDIDEAKARLDVLHTKLLNPTEEFEVDGTDEVVTYHSRLNIGDHVFVSYDMNDALVRLNYQRVAKERKQPDGDVYHAVDLAVGRASIVAVMIAGDTERVVLEELRQITSFTKLVEKLKQASRLIRPENFLILDRYFADAVNHMLRQNLSIPGLEISSFTNDWIELLAVITQQYGDGYRDAITSNQGQELKHLMNFDQETELYVLSQMPSSEGVHPFCLAMPTKMIFINEVSHNLNIDMMPNVASQIMPEVNPFFHDLAMDLLTKDAGQYGRFYIQTSDLRVIEASRSFMNDKAVLLRAVK